MPRGPQSSAATTAVKSVDSALRIMNPVAILRFSPTEGPGHFARWLERNALAFTLVPLDAGAPVPPDARAFSGIVMMGGPMGVNDDLPWIAPVTGLLRDAVAQGVPVLGHCLGGQLLAKALGAPVARAPNPEIGWIDVTIEDGSARREWFGGRAAFTAFQWHYDTFAVPSDGTRVATNPFTPAQAFIVDDRHVGMQFHVEMTPALIEDWLRTGARELPDRSSAARQSAADIRAGVPAHLATLSAVADDVYARWARGLVR
jgi:GMP synthase-like glutamine amidotransferase